MSPSRTRRPPQRLRGRREVGIAVAGAVAVVAGTAFLVWLLRPGPSGTEGTGGLANRQPRAAWLIALVLVALVGFTWWAVRRQRSWQGKFIIVLVTGWLIIGLAAVLAGILWPGGLLRHPPPAPPPVEELPDTPTTLVPPTSAPAPTTPTTGGP